MTELPTQHPEYVSQLADLAVDQDFQLLEHPNNATMEQPMPTLMELAVLTVVFQDVVITSSIDPEVRNVTHQGQDVHPTVQCFAVMEFLMLEKLAISELPTMTLFQTTAELLAPTSLVVMVLETGMRLATLEHKTPTHPMLLADHLVLFLIVVMVSSILNGKNVMMETTSAVTAVPPLANGSAVMDTETQLLRNAIGVLTMECGLIHADQEDSCSTVLTWVAHFHSVEMVSLTVESNVITEEATAMHQMLADQIVPSHTVVMELGIPIMVNGVTSVLVMMTSLETAQQLVFQINAELLSHLLEDTSTSLPSSEAFHHQLSSITDLSLILHVLRMLLIMS
jgi:hypothetical protein